MKKLFSKIKIKLKHLKSSLILLFFGLLWFSNAQNLSNDWYYGDTSVSPTVDATNIGEIIREDNIENTNSLFNRLLSLFQLSNQDWYAEGTSKVFLYIQMIMNILLSLVSFISVVLVIYAFYMMFFSEQEEANAKAIKILKWVAIAIWIIWLSWLIVSLFFNINSTISENI